MKRRSFLNLVTLASGSVGSVLMHSCVSRPVSSAHLSSDEQSLLSHLNSYRAGEGCVVYQPDAVLTDLAREAARDQMANDNGEASGELLGLADLRQQTGYERMLTLSGKAFSGPDFGESLVNAWAAHPLQRNWLGGDYSQIGVGVASASNGFATGIVLLGKLEGQI